MTRVAEKVSKLTTKITEEDILSLYESRDSLDDSEYVFDGLDLIEELEADELEDLLHHTERLIFSLTNHTFRDKV